jgi:hypothetical protein
VTPPAAIDAQWQRDGIDMRAPGGQDERAWWLRGVLSYVPPSHWEERFGAAPAGLVDAARRAAWSLAVYEGWSHAAVLHVDGRWATVLHDWWAQDTSSENAYGLPTLRALLTRVMPAHELEVRALRGLAGAASAEVAGWDEILASIPTPWSVPFGTQVLHGLRDVVQKAGRTRTSHPRVWSRALAHAALALPPACLVQALEPWDLPQSEAHDWHLREWHRQLKAFTDTIHIRQQVVKEIPV